MNQLKIWKSTIPSSATAVKSKAKNMKKKKKKRKKKKQAIRLITNLYLNISLNQ